MDDPAKLIQEEADALFKNVRAMLGEFAIRHNDPDYLTQLQQGVHSIKVLCTLLALSNAARLANKVDETLEAKKAGVGIPADIINITTASIEQLQEEIEGDLDNIPIDPSLIENLLVDWERQAPSTSPLLQDAATCADNLRILVVDDELVSRKLLDNLIKKYNKNIEVITVSTAEEGLFYYLTGKFDLVFLDIIMPVVDGNDFIAIIEKNHELGHLEHNRNIVVQTGVESMEQLLSYVRKSCVQEVIRKPISPQRIADCLERYCQAD